MKCATYCIGVMVGLTGLSGGEGGLKAQELTRAERPEVKVGDRWVTRSKDVATGELRQPFTTTVTEVTDNTIVVQVGGRTVSTLSREWNVIETKVDDKVTFTATPLWMFYQFPLEVGKKWSGRWETTSLTQATSWTADVVVEAIESVTVPAGTFQAFKVRFQGTYNGRAFATGRGSWTGRRQQTVWYAPAVKRAVKGEWQESSPGYTNREAYELQSFSLAQ